MFFTYSLPKLRPGTSQASETILMENHSDETQMPNALFLPTHWRLARIFRDTQLSYKTPGYNMESVW